MTQLLQNSKDLSKYFLNIDIEANNQFHSLKLSGNREIKGPFIWYGLSVIESVAFHLEVFEKAKVKAFLSNAFDLHYQDKKDKRKEIITELTNRGLLHKMDSGGFQLMKAAMKKTKSPLEFTQEMVYDIQSKYNPEVMVQLDVPLSPNLSQNEKLQSNQKTFENFVKLYDLFKDSNSKAKIMPVVHGHNPSMLNDGISQLEERFGKLELIGIGSLVPMVKSVKGTNKIGGKWTFIDSLIYIRNRLPQTFIHAFGIGGTMQYLAFYSGIDSIDSNGWIQKSGYGVIQLPGISDRFMRKKEHNRPHIQNGRKYSRNGKNLVKNEIDILLECKCPICEKTKKAKVGKKERVKMLKKIYDQEGSKGRLDRSIHNVYVQNQELELINQHFLDNSLTSFIESRLETSNYYKLFLYAQALKNGHYSQAKEIRYGLKNSFKNIKDYFEQ